MERPDNSSTDTQHGLPGLETDQSLPAQNTGQRLNEGRLFERYSAGQGEYALLDIDARQPQIFSKAAGVEVRLAQSIANGVVSAETIMAGVAGDVRSGTNPPTCFLVFSPFS